MSFLTSVAGGALPPALGANNANTAISGLGSTAGTGNNFMGSYGATGQQGLNAGLNNLTPVSNWFQTIMNGNKAATLNQFQPQIQQVQQGQQQATDTANNLEARGGGRGSQLFAQPFAAQKDIASQYASARAGAPAGLQSAATAQGALGASAGGIGSQYGDVSSKANNNLLSYGVDQGKAFNKQADYLGSGFGKLISGIFHL